MSVKFSSVGKVVVMQHRWLIKYEKNSSGTYWGLQPTCGSCALGSPPPMSSRHRNLEPLGRWPATIYISPPIPKGIGEDQSSQLSDLDIAPESDQFVACPPVRYIIMLPDCTMPILVCASGHPTKVSWGDG